ncbi:heterokaryon incompatibility protein-domain-containing protein [Coniella lustricola]|uniref:Heterokaryon incompatibility protein-domain-containing protein n=1 Tax=Coniella lustricola TaxID=2025994 RepID=A0A2T3AK13_9PEZI|nr:heterokaryon incompatibility protein-domain-containing protein [Coniella lustricola]
MDCSVCCPRESTGEADPIMSLCRQCQAISTTVVHNDEEGQFVYMHSRASLHQAIADKCYFCTKVQKSFTDDIKALLDSPLWPGIRCSICENRGQYGIDFSIPGKQQINFFWLQDYYDLGVTKFSNTTDDETCWRRIEKWYSTCKASHHKCGTTTAATARSDSNNEQWLPTRLIDTIDAPRGSVRVVDTDTFNTPASKSSPRPYLALSHCWGKQRFLTLTRQNKNSLMRCLPLSELPPNFRDAIYTTRRLGFRYLWIDSLCIIQGADGDWAEQAPLMDRVYMNAELCLAAVASHDAYGGFFRTRDPADLEPFRVDLLLSSCDDQLSSNTSPSSVPISSAPGNDSSPDKRSTKPAKPIERLFYAYCGGQEPGLVWNASVNRAPLNRRGWVKQERVLAPRTIHFGQDQVYWECKMLQACESQPDSALVEYQFENVKDWETKGLEAVAERRGQIQQQQQNQRKEQIQSRKLTMHNMNNNNDSPSPTDQLRAWRHIIGDYALSDLSFEKDKLVAASGLAKAFSRHLNGDEYLAGLWRSHLIKELLWKREKWDNKGQRATATRHKAYRAPTWSWASINGPVVWDVQLRFEDCARVLAVAVEPVTADRTGEVRSALLTLCGYLVPLAWRERIRDFARFVDVEGEEEGIPEEDMMLAPCCWWHGER